MVRSKRWGAEKDAQLSDCTWWLAGGGGREGPRGWRRRHRRRRQPRLTMPPPLLRFGGWVGSPLLPLLPPPDAAINRHHPRGPAAGLSLGREVTSRSGDGGGDQWIRCEVHCPPPPSGSKQRTRSLVGGDNDNDANIHDDDGDNNAGGGDCPSQFDGVRRSQIRGLLAGRRQSHSEVDNGNVPAGLQGGDDNDAIPLPPWDRGSRRWSIVLVVVILVLGIPSQCLPNGRINENNDDDDANDGNNTCVVAGQSRS